MEIPDHISAGLICAACGSALETQIPGNEESVKCNSCSQVYPIVNGIPVIINEGESIFRFTDFTNSKNLFFDISKKGQILSFLGKLMPTVGGNNLGKRNFSLLGKLLLQGDDHITSRVLVIGGSIAGEGMSEFLKSPHLLFTESDVSFGPRTQIIFDAHSIPYQNETFDCVIAQAVLEHVMNPIKCVEEIHRVLKPNGIVYAETPFMQQVHGGPYDFTRYTRSGHRRLFGHFEEIKSGPTAGSGTALAWSYQYFLLALFGYTKMLRLGIKVFARFTGFWIKYLDYLTRLNSRDVDGASGFFFMGRKSTRRIGDEEVVNYYFK